MSLKARLQVWIVSLAAVIVVALSALYLSWAARDELIEAETVAELSAQQLESAVYDLVQIRSAALDPAPSSVEELSRAYVEIVAQDERLAALLQNLAGASPVLVEGLITGPGERILAASIEPKKGQTHRPSPLFEEFKQRGLLSGLFEVLSNSRDYEVVREIGLQGEPLMAIRLVLSSVLVRQQLLTTFADLLGPAVVALLLAVLAAAVVSQIAVRPFARIGAMIDRIATGEAEREEAAPKEVAAVQSKLSLLGEQFRGAREDAQQLRGNIDQLLARLEEAVLLFGRDDRLLMAGGAVERLMPGDRWQALGRPLEEVFPETSELGAFVQSVVKLRRNVKGRQVTVGGGEGPQRLLVSIEVLEEFPSHERVGSLVTLRDAEPRKQIESQLDVSSRLAAISRLTSGAAHEIKNPLNSIALHVEVLKSKLVGADAGAAEVEVISREIRRLDRVVKAFLNFTRPVEMNVETIDLAALLKELAALAAIDAKAKGVDVVVDIPDQPCWVRADRDLLNQALLNVIVNGVQSMTAGDGANAGRELRIGLEPGWAIRIVDQGGGIAPEVQDKIFQLHFTTKREGSGIGLAMAFRVVQLHGGTIDFTSEAGKGSEFRIELPAVPDAALEADSSWRED